ncbi:MAG: dihydropteridine reductase [Ruminococcaceae bacterium]|nr:dihydropteridine reductase [Oscillospiraceae bacterium]
MNKNDQAFLVQKIRTQYIEKEHTELDLLKELDRKVKKPAKMFAYIFGTIASLIMGSGMSLVMTDIGAILGIKNTLITGITVGIIGMLLVIVNYPIYKNILSSRRRKYADQIIALSNEIIGGQGQ